jgi:hypothetical protein
MKHTLRIIIGISLLLSLLVWPGDVRAEVSCEGEACDLLLIFGITEEPDPIAWDMFDATDLNDLNPGGSDRGDGPPDFAVDGLNAIPMAVWSYNLGTSGEIAFTEWTEEGWTPTVLLTADAADDTSPFISSDPDGRERIAWTRTVGGDDSIWLIEREPGAEEWTDARQITSSGRRPSIEIDDIRMMIAYERDAPGGGLEVVLHTRGKGVTPSTQVITTSPRETRLDVEVHVHYGTVWIDWMQSDTEFGFVRLNEDGAWGTEPTLVPWTDSSWIGVEITRREIFIGL